MKVETTAIATFEITVPDGVHFVLVGVREGQGVYRVRVAAPSTPEAIEKIRETLAAFENAVETS